MIIHMRQIFLTFLLLLPLSIYARTVKVAVIDTGFDYKSTWSDIDSKKNDENIPMKKPKLCPEGHIDFTQTSLQDTHGHGTHVAGIISTYAQDADYCLVIIKNFDRHSTVSNFLTTISAFNHAINIGVDIINYSGGGEEFMYDEYVSIQKALDRGIIVVTAAGNYAVGEDKGPQQIDSVIDFVERKPINKNKQTVYEIKVRYINNISLVTNVGVKLGYYPANYDKRIIAVQNVDRSGNLAKSSRFGAAYLYKEMGVDVLSLGLNNSYELRTGTSQAAPKITAKIIKGFKKK